MTGTLAKATEVIIIDLLTLHFRVTTRLCGTIFALLLVQSKGWPFIVSAWGVFNFAMNSGTNVFAQHWLYWQGAIELFNATNPSGTITFSKVNYTVNGIAVGLGVVVAVKRLWWGMYLGKRSYRKLFASRKVSSAILQRISQLSFAFIQGIMETSWRRSSKIC